MIEFLAFLAKYKRDGWSSVLHVFIRPAQWPHEGTEICIREDHFFDPPTFSFVLLPNQNVSGKVTA